MHHVAIMRKSWGLTPKILAGEKVLETRWSKNRSPPWGRVRPGDVVYFKDAGEPVTLKAEVSEVIQFEGLVPSKVREILQKYGERDGLEPGEIPRFFSLFRDRRYCVLVFLRNPRGVESFHIEKEGFGAQAAWITLNDINKIRKRI